MELKIDEIVKQVLSEVNAIHETRPKTETVFELNEKPVFTGHEKGKTAVLTSPENYEIKEFTLPEIGPKDILVKVEGCCITPSDTTEFLRERRVGEAFCGRQGTGVILKLGSEDLKDANNVPLKTGDFVVGMKSDTKALPAYGVRSRENGVQPTGWFSNYMILQAGKNVYQVNDLDLESRMLTECAITINSAVMRAAKLAKLDSAGNAIVLGCGLEGLLAIASLKCMGVNNIVAIGEDENSLKIAQMLGAKDVLSYAEKKGMAGALEKVRKYFGGSLADVVFHCTGSSMAGSMAKRFVKASGTVSELGGVLGKSRAVSRFYEETLPLGGRHFTSKDYEDGFAFLRKAAEKEIPLYRLVTHRYMLDQMNEAHWTAIREDGLAIAVFNR